MSEKTIARSTTRRETVKAPFVAPTIITWSLTPPLARDHAPRERDRAQHEEIPRPPRSEN
jgi:hypothetical protein